MARIKNPFKRKKVLSNHDLRSQAILDMKPESYMYSGRPIGSVRQIWDGEKSVGELGAAIDYLSDFRTLAIRSWQSFYSSDITQMIVKNHLLWAVGRGLHLQSQPVDRIISKFESNFNKNEFTDDVETLWDLYATSTDPSHNGMQDITQLAAEAKLNAIVGGDCLIVMRLTESGPTYQLIDGLHVTTPFDSALLKAAKDAGNKIKDGVEIDPTGKHVAFYVWNADLKHQRVPAYNEKTGTKIAWLMYGVKYRTNDTRGMSLLAVIISKLQKMDRWVEATISSAEESAKIIYSIEHTKDGTGENPLSGAIANAFNAGSNDGKDPETERNYGEETARKIATSTNNQAFNLPPESKMVSFKSEKENNFGDFFTPNFNIVCATFGIPPEVALAMYNSNYSASRMAVKTWEHKINVDRDDIIKTFFKPLYCYWLDTSILKNEITTTGYIRARMKGNKMVMKAFMKCNFYGENMPHVDPLKEVLAERKKLGNDIIPLTTFEKAARNTNSGEWKENVDGYEKEKEYSSKLNLDNNENN